MTKDGLLSELMEILQISETLVESDNLNNMEEWDSMAKLGVMSLFDIEFGVDISSDEIRKLMTVGDLLNIVSDKFES